jgi:hypothetical protein
MLLSLVENVGRLHSSSNKISSPKLAALGHLQALVDDSRSVLPLCQDIVLQNATDTVPAAAQVDWDD